MRNLIVEFYGRKDCAQCRDVSLVIGKVKRDIPFQLKEIDITANEDLLRRFKEDIPMVFINGKKAFKFRIDETEFRRCVRKEFIRTGMLRLWTKKEHFG
ncbi:MAG: glutaredoxin family protein [Deltaproteobacteria bacterium]|nr:glutaredoxin family protein [Deltaproteobacteria bacterium]